MVPQEAGRFNRRVAFRTALKAAVKAVFRACAGG